MLELLRVTHRYILCPHPRIRLIVTHHFRLGAGCRALLAVESQHGERNTG